MDDNLRQYLMDKYKDQLGDINTAQAFANLGDVIAGQKVGSTSPFFSEQRGLAEKQTLGELGRQEALEAKKAQAQQELQMRLLGLAQQRQLGEQGLDIKRMVAEGNLAAKEKKAEDLSTAQAKQLGLAEMGQLANKQYSEAIQQGFKPTEYSSKLDFVTWMPQFLKSDLGKKAVAAQENWVENYLRDASGAAIPLSERSSYAEIYFPRPGDTQDIVANKEQLRKQKEANALIGAGKGAERFTVPKMQSQEDTKIINGQSYKKVEGGWQKVSE